MTFDADLVEEFSDEKGNEVMKMILQRNSMEKYNEAEY